MGVNAPGRLEVVGGEEEVAETEEVVVESHLIIHNRYLVRTSEWKGCVEDGGV